MKEPIYTGLINSVLRHYFFDDDVQTGWYDYIDTDKLWAFIHEKYHILLESMLEGIATNSDKSENDVAVFELAMLLTKPLNEYVEKGELIC